MSKRPEKAYDVVVVGAGHAGCEAALAAARMGARTALVTMDRDMIASMPCNPSIGGIAKSHLVFEIDTLGGEMARNADFTAIQFRVLNTRKGPAVQANREQSDKAAYAARMRRVIETTSGLDVVESEVTGLWIEGTCLKGVTCGNDHICGKTVVLTPGTFLHGTIHVGDSKFPGGRCDEAPADHLGANLKTLGFRMARLKTGTPPRLAADSLDYDVMVRQSGETPAPFFSWRARRHSELFHVEQSPDICLMPWAPGTDQLPCYITQTTLDTHEIIRSNLQKSSLYGGHIDGTGVRYCPSVEDKIVKFPEKISHHVFIEPEGRSSPLVYPNGISNSLPPDIQLAMVRSIPGLRRAAIVKPGYAIQYDFCDPTELCHTLETKKVERLFMAGQINGTTGYEEAAAQGLIAGINAARRAMGIDGIVLSRSTAYIGVLIDDLVTKGTNEPYRMFTSRAEHRLLLRQDNASFRLLSITQEIGIAGSDFIEETSRFERETEAEIERLRHVRSGGVSLAQLLRRPETTHATVCGEGRSLHPDVIRQVEIRIKYEGYIRRETQQVSRAVQLEAKSIPAWLEYSKLSALRYEAREKLSRVRPVTLGQASRIPGISPADISVLAVAIKRGPTP